MKTQILPFINNFNHKFGSLLGKLVIWAKFTKLGIQSVHYDFLTAIASSTVYTIGEDLGQTRQEKLLSGVIVNTNVRSSSKMSIIWKDIIANRSDNHVYNIPLLGYASLGPPPCFVLSKNADLTEFCKSAAAAAWFGRYCPWPIGNQIDCS